MIGFGHTPFERHDALSLEDLIRSAIVEALASAGVEARDVDAVRLGQFNSALAPDGFCSCMVLGVDPALRFKPAVRCGNARASGPATLYAALEAVRSGRVKVALVVGAEKMSGLDTRALGGAAYRKEKADPSFPDIFARFAHGYAAPSGDSREAMAHIAVKNHANAMMNPLAQMSRPFSLEFRVTDFAKTVRFPATTQLDDLPPLSVKELSGFEGMRRAIAQIYDQARIGLDDLNLAELHDRLTVAELLAVKAVRLAPPGEGRAAGIDGRRGLTGGYRQISLAGLRPKSIRSAPRARPRTSSAHARSRAACSTPARRWPCASTSAEVRSPATPPCWKR